MTSQLEDESSEPSQSQSGPVMGPQSPPPENRRLIAIIASIGAMAAIALILSQAGLLNFSNLLGETDSQHSPPPSVHEMTGAVIGHIQSVEGQVEIRPPRGTQFYQAVVQPLVAEALVQTQSASAAVIEFQSGPTIRLLANSRLVAELDPTQEGTVHATLIAGEFTVLNPGTSETFTISQNGVPIEYKAGTIARKVPLIPVTDEATAAANGAAGGELSEQENSTAEIVEKMEAEKESELATMPSTELPTIDPKSKVTNQAGADAKEESRESGPTDASLLSSTLTNDDIRSQMKAQAGGFQKCYVSMVNRMSEESGERTAGELPRGEVLVTFKILASGKVEETKVLRSPFQDELFERCLVEALGRIRFRPFQGATIPVAEFPIVLE